MAKSIKEELKKEYQQFKENQQNKLINVFYILESL